jgi:hypothetical protein
VTPAKFGGSNDETFNAFDQAKWDEVRQNFDKVLTELEKLVAAADEKTLQSWAPTLGRIARSSSFARCREPGIRQRASSKPDAVHRQPPRAQIAQEAV